MSGSNVCPPLDVVADDLQALCRAMVVGDVTSGRTEDEIYRRRIDSAIEAARLGGCDEADVKVIADVTRSIVADVLAECRQAGWI
jgi:hypothetical protein